MNAPRDTIAAIATSAGGGGIGVIRISGPGTRHIARALLGKLPRPRHAHYARFRDADGGALDAGLALWFPAPRSFTGEDVLELHAHGSPVVLDLLLHRCAALGARLARPGEFSERAFLEGKLDLAQAEAVADLVAAGSEAQARAALRSLDGVFSRRVNGLLDALVRLRLYVEAAIDFPEEEIDFLADEKVGLQLQQAMADTQALIHEADIGQRLRDGLHVAIIGRPNAGKSSLLNALAGSERAIVTAVPGTTRDLLRETVRLGASQLTLVDTAGLRDTGDIVEAEGVRRARAELARADLALLVLDATHDPEALRAEQAALRAECPPGCAIFTLLNKTDQLVPSQIDAALAACASDALPISATSGAGLDRLRDTLVQRAGGEGSSGSFSARARHVDALRRVAAHLAEGERQLLATRAGELLAEELRQAQQALGEITGTYSSDDLLGAIFSSFCIGK